MPLDVAFRAFLLSRRAARCTPKTLEHYQYTVGGFVQWLGELDVATVQEITASHIRTYLVSLQDRGLKDTTQHAHARGIKAWLNWLVREGDLEESPMRNVAMPRLEKRVPAPFTAEDVRALLDRLSHRMIRLSSWGQRRDHVLSQLTLAAPVARPEMA